jgi:hypothetical protein
MTPSTMSSSKATYIKMKRASTGTKLIVNNGTFSGFTGGTGTASFASTGTITAGTISNYIVSNSTSVTIDSNMVDWADGVQVVEREVIPKKVHIGTAFEMEMPDGSKLTVDASGNYKIEDKDAKITYQANRLREFNRYLNASDLIAEFIGDLGKLGATQGKVLHVPIELFINWLIIRAAEADGEEPAEDVPKLAVPPMLLPAPKPIPPKCGFCGRWIPKFHATSGVMFCNGTHADGFILRKIPRDLRSSKRTRSPLERSEGKANGRTKDAVSSLQEGHPIQASS